MRGITIIVRPGGEIFRELPIGARTSRGGQFDEAAEDKALNGPDLLTTDEVWTINRFVHFRADYKSLFTLRKYPDAEKPCDD
jgi:hypothetical protein